jgi:NAD(P)H-hydrate epimerase
VAEAGRPLSYNTTGNPGMATGGMGDVLTGVCSGLLGAKLSPNDAARVGAWLCGRAAELALSAAERAKNRFCRATCSASSAPRSPSCVFLFVRQ